MKNREIKKLSFYISERNIESVFEQISTGLTRDWKDVGIPLGLTFDDFGVITAPQPLPDDPALRMLEIWMNSCSAAQRRPKLIAALRQMERLDIVQILSKWGYYLYVIAKFKCPRVLDNQKMRQGNQKVRPGCPPDYQICCERIDPKHF